MMKVKDLIIELEKCDPEAIVIRESRYKNATHYVAIGIWSTGYVKGKGYGIYESSGAESGTIPCVILD